MSTTHHEAKLACESRATLGSRNARALRREGRLPASLQFEGTGGALHHFSIEEAAFQAAHRHEAHLFDLDLEGGVQSAVIREIQYDAFGSTILHVDFKGVIRGQLTDVRVPLSVLGTAAGTLNQAKDAIEVSCLPKDIPDTIEVNVDGMAAGTQLHASQLTLPEGVTLSAEEAKEDEVVINIVEQKAAAEPEAEGEEGGDEA